MKSILCWSSVALLSSAALVVATPPPLYYRHLESAAAGRVSLYSLPDGNGAPLTGAFLWSYNPGESPAIVDATLTLTVLEDDITPIRGIPAVDLWLETDQGGMIPCAGGTIADGPTNTAGVTTFSGALRAGGASAPLAGERMVAAHAWATVEADPVDVQVNSPDQNGDLRVDLSDVVIFTESFHTGYTYSADLYWDGELNLSDVVLLAMALGAECP